MRLREAKLTLQRRLQLVKDSLSTQALMTSTFRNIKAGETALKALSDAQRTLVDARYVKGEYHFSRSHPFFWAPFVYVGD